MIVHVILGLPGETTDQMKETVTYLADRPIDGIKLQLLHILKGTDLADVYQTDPFHVFFYRRIYRSCDRLYHAFTAPDHHSPHDR